jgi:hypothetical protein
MWYDTDKQELMGDKDLDITELVHITDLNYIPTGKDINEDSDLNFPPGPDREIDISLANILDYYSADLTCLEGSSIDPDAVQPENYSSTHDLKDTCYVRYWVLNGTRHTSRRWGPGETIHAYFRKDNPDFDITDNIGLNAALLESQASGKEDGIFGMEGYIRFDYNHPEEEPTKYVNAPFDTSISVDALPNYVEPTYSDYGTRMYDEMGYGDQRNKNGTYISALSDKIWEQVLSDPSNAFYNGNYDWRTSDCDGCETIGETIRKGGGYNNQDDYSRIYEDDGKYYQYLGRGSLAGGGIFGTYANRYYYVILNKDHNNHGPLSGGRVKHFNTSKHNDLKNQYKPYSDLSYSLFSGLSNSSGEGGAESFKNAKKFPQDENGYYISQEYWDEFGLI